MKTFGMFSIGAGALLIVVAAAKAIGRQAEVSTATKPEPSPAPTPTPSTEGPPITGLPPDVIQIITEARASNDPDLIREAAYKLADNYARQAADLLALATVLEQPPDVK